MYSRKLAECFPPESIDKMWECCEPHCFYYEILLGVDEVVWAYRWSKVLEDLVPIAKCPSCFTPMADWSLSEMKKENVNGT